MSGYRKPYTVEEEMKILEYIIRTKGHNRVRGLTMWKELSRDELPDRTYQSLHERFRRHIVNNLPSETYDIPTKEQQKIKKIFDELGKGSKRTEEDITLENTVSKDGRKLARNLFEDSDSDTPNEVE
ncbi:hypothetical protein HHI36_016146 [Cryptolaemus montrouzieri]|uniref:Telomeric repeat-binding factor 2-interacting protein 1 n=1 Tax=Cryptolaemus montrouzieri TaxID=559131 RepID=A0ABD2NJ20_9CUCU